MGLAASLVANNEAAEELVEKPSRLEKERILNMTIAELSPSVKQEEWLRGFDPLTQAHRVCHPDLFVALGKRGLLKPYYLWYMALILDSDQRRCTERALLVEHCAALRVWEYVHEYENAFTPKKGFWRPKSEEKREARHWKERTLDKHLARGNDILWKRPEGRNMGNNRGLIVYHTPAEVFEILDVGPRRFEARLMPPWCLDYGFDYWLHCQLRGFVGHANGKPFSREKIAKQTGVRASTQTRVGLYGDRNCLIRPILKQDDLSPESLKHNRLMRRGDDTLLGFLGSSYDALPVIRCDPAIESCEDLDWFPRDRFCFHTEDEAREAHEQERRYKHYVVLHPEGETTSVPAGRGAPWQDAAVWVPGKDSDHWKPLVVPWHERRTERGAEDTELLSGALE